NQNQGQGAKRVHIYAGHPRQQGEFRQAANGQQGAQNQAAGCGQQRKLEGKYHALAEQIAQRAFDDVKIESVHGITSFTPLALDRLTFEEADVPRKPGTATRRSSHVMPSTMTRFSNKYSRVAPANASNT